MMHHGWENLMKQGDNQEDWQVEPMENKATCLSSCLRSIDSPPYVCWGLPEKFGWLPKHKWEFLARSSSKWERKKTVIPSASSTSSKKSDSVYTCPCAPFYRETKGLLHTDNTLSLREYSYCERIQDCLFHLTYLQICH
jgi:hypothetical protein